MRTIKLTNKYFRFKKVEEITERKSTHNEIQNIEIKKTLIVNNKKML
jgi:hypothetical protein